MNLLGSSRSGVKDIDEETSSAEHQYERTTASTNANSISPLSSNRVEKKIFFEAKKILQIQ